MILVDRFWSQPGLLTGGTSMARIAVEYLHVDAAMTTALTADRKGEKAGCEASMRPQNGANKGTVRTLESARNANAEAAFDDADAIDAANARRRSKANGVHRSDAIRSYSGNFSICWGVGLRLLHGEQLLRLP